MLLGSLVVPRASLCPSALDPRMLQARSLPEVYDLQLSLLGIQQDVSGLAGLV